MHRVGTDVAGRAVTFLAVEDEIAASQSTARLLITASTQRGVETLARRIHGAGPRAGLPLVHMWAGDFPIGGDALREHCSGFIDAASGGSMLISDVQKLPPIVQEVLLELVASLERARRPSSSVRLISGTTVSLLDRVIAGSFSERLFYRLNTIHLMAGDPPDGRATPTVRDDRFIC